MTLSLKRKEGERRKKRYIITISVAVLALTVAVYYAKESGTYKNSRVWNFDSYIKGIVPEGFSSTDRYWGVADDDLAYSKPNVMMYVGSNDDSDSYGKESSGDSKTGVDTSLLINSEGIYSNFKASVKVKVSDKGSAGLVFRFIDTSHYFVLLIDEANDRFSLCRMDPGRLLCLQDAQIKIEGGRWYSITAYVSTQAIVGYLDDKPLLKRYDSHYMSGMIGLFAKGNTIAYDDLQIYY